MFVISTFMCVFYCENLDYFIPKVKKTQTLDH